MKSWKSLTPYLLLTLTLLHCGRSPEPLIESDLPSFILSGRLVPMSAENAVIDDGALLVSEGRIAAIWDRAEGPPVGIDLAGIELIETQGLIFPGLIDLHSHPHYNVLPLWQPEIQFRNRREWQSLKSNRTDSAWPIRILTREWYEDLFEEVMVYAEVKALIGGTTTLQGSPGNHPGRYSRVLVRNVEHSPLGVGRIQDRVRPVEEIRFAWFQNLISRLRGLDAYIIHLAEGVDPSSRQELQTIEKKGLLNEDLVLIHGVALEAEDFTRLGEVGAKLVWSPLSNLLLYGDTADVRAAVDAGVLISLGSDWSRTGSKNLLGELKVADQWNRRAIDPPLTDFELIQMVTVNPARTLHWEEWVGTLGRNLLADLLVVRDPGGDPYRTLIESGDEDVLLVTIAGDPLYGQPEWMQRLKPGDFEVVSCGVMRRGLDISQDAVDWEGRSFARIESTLATAMRFETWRDSLEFEGLRALQLTPLFFDCDAEHRRIVEEVLDSLGTFRN